MFYSSDIRKQDIHWLNKMGSLYTGTKTCRSIFRFLIKWMMFTDSVTFNISKLAASTQWDPLSHWHSTSRFGDFLHWNRMGKIEENLFERINLVLEHYQNCLKIVRSSIGLSWRPSDLSFLPEFQCWLTIWQFASVLRGFTFSFWSKGRKNLSESY